MRTITKRIAGAALAVGMLGGAGLATAGPASAETLHYYKKAEARTKEACQAIYAAQYASLRYLSSGNTIESATSCRVEPGGSNWVGWIFYSRQG